MGRNRKGRDLSGVVVLDKPRDMTSSDAVQHVKSSFNARKVGHTGSLDPLATGVLPLCFGEATKFSRFLLTSDKKYWVKLKLGIRTASGDADGDVVEERSTDGVTQDRIQHALESFRGEIDQIPSMYSAIKYRGKPLYKYARQGVEIERESRRINVYSIELSTFSGSEMTLRVHCSKGTYVRTIVDDLGEQLGCGAHVVELRRLMAGPFTESDMVTFEEIETARVDGRLDELLAPISSAVSQWPAVRLSATSAYYIRQGQPVLVPHAPSEGWVQLRESCSNDEWFLGMGEIMEDGRVAPRRLILGERKL
ncbi:MAG TPA: tRNA pseudouridine(55) synthase TruB [Gammaproteobacteria bacterium]|nr:tRNA pseudouridine(55) synthase TruB [Gammaproteobacteria bacterium]